MKNFFLSKKLPLELKVINAEAAKKSKNGISGGGGNGLLTFAGGFNFSLKLKLLRVMATLDLFRSPKTGERKVENR